MAHLEAVPEALAADCVNGDGKTNVARPDFSVEAKMLEFTQDLINLSIRNIF